MEKKLGVVTLEQLGRLLTFPNRPCRTPEPTQREENPLQVPPTNRTATYVRNRPAAQDPEQKLQDDLRRCREYCKEQALEVVIEYSDPKGSRKEFRQMMTVATGRRPRSTTSWSQTSIAGSPPTLRTTWIASSTSGRTASSSGQCHQVCKARGHDARHFENCRHC